MKTFKSFLLEETGQLKYRVLSSKFNYTRKDGSTGTVQRIVALKAFSDVKAGELGGYVESEKNLSQEGNCWIYGAAAVRENAEVTGNAKIMDHAAVFGDAKVGDNVVVKGNALVYGNKELTGNQVISSGQVH